MDTTCLKACCLLLDAIGPPPEADEFMAELCREGAAAERGYPLPTLEAVVDGT